MSFHSDVIIRIKRPFFFGSASMRALISEKEEQSHV